MERRHIGEETPTRCLRQIGSVHGSSKSYTWHQQRRGPLRQVLTPRSRLCVAGWAVACTSAPVCGVMSGERRYQLCSGFRYVECPQTWIEHFVASKPMKTTCVMCRGWCHILWTQDVNPGADTRKLRLRPVLQQPCFREPPPSPCLMHLCASRLVIIVNWRSMVGCVCRGMCESVCVCV